MGVTVVGRTEEEIKHLLKFSIENIKNIRSFLVIYLIPEEKSESSAREEIESFVKEMVREIPYEIKPFIGSIDSAIETFIAKREDLRIVFVHIGRLDIRNILLGGDAYTNILKSLEKGVINVPIVFVPHR